MKSQAIAKATRIHSEGGMNVCSQIHGNSSNNWQDISLNKKNVNFMVVLEEKSGGHQNNYDSSSGDQECVHKISWQSIQ